MFGPTFVDCGQGNRSVHTCSASLWSTVVEETIPYIHAYIHTYIHTYERTYIHTPDLALERKATGPLDAHWRWTACLDVNMTVAAMHCAWKIRVSTFLFSRKCWHALGALRVTHRIYAHTRLEWIISDQITCQHFPIFKKVLTRSWGTEGDPYNIP